MICTVNLLNRDGKVLNVRDISEVLSELEEQEEPKEESSNGSNKFVYNHDYHDDSDVKKKGPVQQS